ncbi:hypothetical protein [Streptomyces sp. NPDC057616]|uniref:hypothetical protein n=1 Tax=Streptomyces sp. NPDC057616 TaxID=3346183 RepID=UPI00367FD4B8
MTFPRPRSNGSEPSIPDRLRRLDDALVQHYTSAQGNTQMDLEYIRQEAARRHKVARRLGVDPVTAVPKHEQEFTITVNWSGGRLVLTMPTGLIYGAKTVLGVFFGLFCFVISILLGKSTDLSTLTAITVTSAYLVASLARRPRRIEADRLRGLQRVKPVIMKPPSTETTDQNPSTSSA